MMLEKTRQTLQQRKAETLLNLPILQRTKYSRIIIELERNCSSKHVKTTSDDVKVVYQQVPSSRNRYSTIVQERPDPFIQTIPCDQNLVDNVRVPARWREKLSLNQHR